MQCTYVKRMMPSIFVFRNVQREMWFQDQYHDRDLNKLMTFVSIMGLLDVVGIYITNWFIWWNIVRHEIEDRYGKFGHLNTYAQK